MDQPSSLINEASSSDQSIIAGLGYSSDFDLSLEPFGMKEPTAASTAYALKSRDFIMEKLLEHQGTTVLKAFRKPNSDHTVNVDDLLKNISPPKTFQERLLAAKKHLPMITIKSSKNPMEDVSFGSNSSFINIDDMSGLSSSSFLVNSVENMRNKVDDNNASKIFADHGLPSILISGSKISNKVGRFEEDPWGSSERNHSQQKELVYNSENYEDSLLGKEIEAGLDQLSARSLSLQKSNLLSHSCNSLGSFGKVEEEDCSFSSVSQLGEQSLNSFLIDQRNMTEFVDQEEFKSINIMEFEKDEEKFKNNRSFQKDITFSNELSNAADDLSGLYSSSQNITVRDSWLGSLNCDLKPGDKINIEQLFKAKSCNLGSLGDEFAEKPSFGLGNTVSPPKEIPVDDVCFKALTDNEGPFKLLPNSFERESGDGREKIDDDTSIPKCNFSQSSPANLAQSLGDLHNSVGTDQFKKLLLEASVAEDPAKMINRVLKVIEEGAYKNNEDESSIADTSYEVLELRKIKEERIRQIYGSSRAKQNHRNKENIDQFKIGDKFADNNAYRNNISYNPSQVFQLISENYQKEFDSSSSNTGALKQLNCAPVLQENHSYNLTNNNLSNFNSLLISSPKRPTRFRMGTSSLRTNSQGQGISTETNLQTMINLSSNSIRTAIESSSLKDPTASQNICKPSTLPTKQGFTDPEPQLDIPSEVQFTEPCLTNIKSETSINVYNPSDRFVNVLASELKETVNDKIIINCFLLMKHVNCIQAKSSCKISIGLCASISGSYKADLKLSVSELDGKLLYDKWISIYANIVYPDVEVVCDGSSTIDLGLVAESCLVRKQVGIINQSNSPYPVILNLINKLETTTEVLYFSEDNKGITLLTPTLAACELPPSKKPSWVTVMFKAPCLDNFTGDSKCLMVDVTFQLLIAIDRPYGSPLIIKEAPIKVKIGEVRIRTIRNEIPFILKASSRDTVAKDFSLKNESSFPITIKAGFLDSSTVFTVSPSTLVIEPETKAVVKISLNPNELNDGIETERWLQIGVVPEGMEFEVPIKGILKMTTTLPSKGSINSLTKSVNENSGPISHLSNLQEKNIQLNSQRHYQITQNKINRELSMECNKSCLVFGTVNVSSTESQNLILYNTWPDESLVLNVAIVGCKAFEFTMSNELNNEKSKSRELVIAPSGQANLTIYFEPSGISCYSASLVCKPKGLVKQVKITLPLHGFGGSGDLTFGKNEELNVISLGEISPGNPTIGNATVRNSGDRAIFVKLLALFDDSSEEVISSSDIKIIPADFVLNPGEARDILLVALGTPFLIAKAPGKVAVFQAIFGDEILRSRFRKLKSRKIKNTKIKDLSLLNIKWDTTFVNEKEVIEKDDLSLQADDCLLFLNGCRKKKISIHAEIDPESEVSSSMFSFVPQEETCTSFIQTHLEENSFASRNQMGTNGVEIKTNIWQDFNSFPNDLRLSFQSPAQRVTVVNYSNKDQPIEAVCEDLWLSIEPPEAMVRLSKFSVLYFKINGSKLPSSRPRILKTIVEILGENCRSIVHVTLDLSTDSLPSVDHYKYNKNNSNRSSTKSISSSTMVSNSDKNNRHCKVNVPEKSDGPSSNVMENINHVKGDSSNNVINASKESKVELVTDKLEFPTINAKTKDAAKLTLRNYDKIPHKIKAALQSKQFFIRHTSFEIKPGFHVNLPVYFAPQCQGSFSAQLVLTVIEDKKELITKLHGKAI